jgi:hypothetical protein
MLFSVFYVGDSCQGWGFAVRVPSGKINKDAHDPAVICVHSPE